MKFPLPDPTRLAIDCAALLLLHTVMLQVLARTHIMEKLMALQFNKWELAVIVAFILLRLAVYFLIPSVIASLLVWELLRRVRARESQ